MVSKRVVDSYVTGISEIWTNCVACYLYYLFIYFSYSCCCACCAIYTFLTLVFPILYKAE